MQNIQRILTNQEEKGQKEKKRRAVNLEGASPKWISKRPISTGGASPLSLPWEAQQAANTGGAGPPGTAGCEAAWTTRSVSKTEATGMPVPCHRLQPSQPPGQLCDPNCTGEHVMEPPRDVQTELVRVCDCETSEKTSRRHQSPSPRKQPEHPSTGGGKALGWHIHDTETNLSSRKQHKRAPAAQHTYTKFQTRGGHAPRAARADRKLIEVLKIQDPVKFQKQGSGCTVTLTHSFSEKNPSPRPTPHPCLPSRKNSHGGQGVPRPKARHGRGQAAGDADFQPGSRESRRSVKEGREGKACMSGVGRKTPETRRGAVGAVIIMMRAGPGGSTEQKPTATSLN